ncbi:MAG: hypothetical protein P4L83_20630, partial [Nevskia sp.]|nr:hypothetical protein [Nevskia sp.]
PDHILVFGGLHLRARSVFGLVRQHVFNVLHATPRDGERGILYESDAAYRSLLPDRTAMMKPPAHATASTPIRWMVAFSSAEAAGEVYQRFVVMRRTCGSLPANSPLRDLDIQLFVAGDGQAGSQHVEQQMASAAVCIRQSETAAAAAAPAAVQEVDYHMAQEMGGLNLLADARGDHRGQPERPTVVRRLFGRPAEEVQPQPEQRVENAPMQLAPQQSPPAQPSPPMESNPQPHLPYQHAQLPYGAFPPSGGPMGAPPMPPPHGYGPYPHGPSSYWSPPHPFGHYPPPPPEYYHAHAYAAAAAYSSSMHAHPPYYPPPPPFYGNPPPAPRPH